jgi:hypothetical protein
MNWNVPTIAGIQRMTVLLTIVAGAALFAFVSTAAAIGALAGGILMIVNLYLLVLVGKMMVALAGGGGAGTVDETSAFRSCGLSDNLAPARGSAQLHAGRLDTARSDIY